MKKTASKPSEFSSGDIPISNPGQRTITIVPADFKNKSAIGNSYKTLFNFDIVQAYAEAESIGRLNDYLKLEPVLQNDSIFTKANKNVVDVGVGGNTELNVAKITEAKFKMLANGAKQDQLSLWANASVFPKLMKDPLYTSKFYNDKQPLTMSGEQPGILNISFRTLLFSI